MSRRPVRIKASSLLRAKRARSPLDAVETRLETLRAGTQRADALHSAAEGFAASLGVPTCVMQCTYIAVQIGELIANLDRPPRMVLTDLITGMDLIRNAGKQLELDAKNDER